MSRFDLEVFPGFRELLIALEPYAQKSGFRFRLADMSVSDFVLVGEEDGMAATVATFTSKLKAGDPQLIAELGMAARATEQEGLRNVMIATCKELRLWPPTTPDRLESIAYSDTSEPLESIAWALYNHEQCSNEDHRATCRTASFLVDFGHAYGALDVSGASKAGTKLLTEFLAQATLWTNDHMLASRPGVRDIVIRKLQEFADPNFVCEIERWLDKHWEAVAVGTIALVAGFVFAAIAIGKASRE